MLQHGARVFVAIVLLVMGCGGDTSPQATSQPMLDTPALMPRAYLGFEDDTPKLPGQLPPPTIFPDRELRIVTWALERARVDVAQTELTPRALFSCIDGRMTIGPDARLGSVLRTGFTLELWMFPMAHHDMHLIDAGNWMLSVRGGRLVIKTRGAQMIGPYVVSGTIANPDRAIADREMLGWQVHHLAITGSAAGLRLFLNGMPVFWQIGDSAEPSTSAMEWITVNPCGEPRTISVGGVVDEVHSFCGLIDNLVLYEGVRYGVGFTPATTLPIGDRTMLFGFDFNGPALDRSSHGYTFELEGLAALMRL